MAITDRNLKGGEKLVATYKGKQYTCDVRKGQPDEGGTFGLEYVVGGKTFTSPSAAGMHVRDGKATNGWAFWSNAAEGEISKAGKAHAQKVSRPERPDGLAGGPHRAEEIVRGKVTKLPKRNKAAEEANAANPPTAKVIPIRKSKALQCDECPEKRKTPQALASHKRAHARALAAVPDYGLTPVEVQA